jgi:hypothetical protein
VGQFAVDQTDFVSPGYYKMILLKCHQELIVVLLWLLQVGIGSFKVHKQEDISAISSKVYA